MAIPSLARSKWLAVLLFTLLLITSHQLVTHAAGVRLPSLHIPAQQNASLHSTEALTTTETVSETTNLPRGGITLNRQPRQASETPVAEEEAAPTALPEEDTTAVAEEEATPAAEEEAATESGPPPIDNLADARSAVVQIEAVGTFVDPAEGLQLDAAGRGSGFIIDPSGIAVTNNHVVTGGGLYKVFIDGEEEPRSAKVLGVSECADLAVIDIQGEDFPYLDWYEGAIRVGLDVYAAGFPLGDPEYTLTRGIIAKEKADGETSWASVSKVLQHDADINPGNSGGPLIDEDGRVVGINYAGNSETNQSFAISRDEALPIIEQLRTGINIDTIGVNGEAVSDGDQLTGIWVASVKSGSPADQTGIKPGDILMSLEGITLAEDGTMTTYCDVLRSHSAEDVLAVQVLRFETQEVLEGQINGRELAQSFTFADELNGEESTTGDQGSTTDAPTEYSGYTTVSDRGNVMALEVPVEWAETEDGDWVRQEETVGVRLVATTDLATFYDSWSTPGVIFNVSSSMAATETPETLLDAFDLSESCTNGGREAIPDGFYTGYYDLWTDCDGSSRAVIVSVMPETQDFIVLFQIYIASEADVDALDHILDSFVVTLPSTTGAGTGSDENIFDLVDVSGLQYDYAYIDEPALSGILPADWADIATNDWLNDDDEVLGKTLSVSTDIKEFQDTWTTPGIYVRTATDLEEELDIADLLDSADLADTCTYDDRYEHSHTIYGVTYSGFYDLYTNCDGEENAFAYLVVQSDSLKQAVLLEFLAIDEADVEAFDVLLQSFYVSDGSVATSDSSTAGDEAEYTLLTDDTEALTVRVPASWSDVASGDWTLDDEVIGVQLKASTDLAAYDAGWEAPGLFFGASAEFADADTAETLDALDFADDCDSSERFEYDDSVFVGHYDLWEGCGGTDNLWVVLAAAPKASPDYLVILNILLAEDSDLDAFDEILKSFNVTWSDENGDDVEPIAEVVTDALNVRSGPGTGYGRVGGVSQGDQLSVIGEYDNCSWLNIVTRDETEGWISGSSRYVTLNVDCDAIPAVDPPAPPSNSGGNTPRPGTGNTGGTASNQGCYLFQNQLGAELNITFTRPSDGWNTTFKVGRDAEVRQCFDAGDYTYTLDAPPPWGSTNGEMSVSAGDDYLFPITPAE